ncbi:MAG: chemotaxis protein CheW, partial [Bdellovibrionia bacterium]
EVDKTVLEQLGDPLVHIVRNAVDHGLEDRAGRLDAGKPEAGRVRIQASHQGRFLVIEIKDDGRGIDTDRLVKKAIEKGIIADGETMSREDALNLIFHPGFSMKAEVTEISGRGVGLDVVKKNVEAMQGEVRIDTSLGEGTTFKILLPLTLAIIDGMVSIAGRDRFVIPVNHIQETLQPKAADLSRASNVGEILNLRGAFLPVFNLSHLMGQKAAQKPTTEMIALVVSTREGPCCVTVDDILNQQQVVIKKLGSEFAGRAGITGSAILGDGKPSLILDLAELVLSRAQIVRREKAPVRAEKGAA